MQPNANCDLSPTKTVANVSDPKSRGSAHDGKQMIPNLEVTCKCSVH